MKGISCHVDAAAEQAGDAWGEETPSKARQRNEQQNVRRQAPFFLQRAPELGRQAHRQRRSDTVPSTRPWDYEDGNRTLAKSWTN